MSSTKLHKTLKGLALASAIGFGLIAVTGTSVNAQNRNQRDDGYSDNQDDRQDNDRRDQDNDRYNQNRRDQDNDRYNGRDRNGNQSIRFAFQKGYQRGLQQGMRDARNRRHGNSGYYGNNQGYGNNGDYNGNNQGYGNNGRIQQAFQ